MLQYHQIPLCYALMLGTPSALPAHYPLSLPAVFTNPDGPYVEPPLSCLQADLSNHLHQMFAQHPKGFAIVSGRFHDAYVGAAEAADHSMAACCPAPVPAARPLPGQTMSCLWAFLGARCPANCPVTQTAACAPSCWRRPVPGPCTAYQSRGPWRQRPGAPGAPPCSRL